MRGCADFIRQDKADAGKGYGAFSMWRSLPGQGQAFPFRDSAMCFGRA